MDTSRKCEFNEFIYAQNVHMVLSACIQRKWIIRSANEIKLDFKSPNTNQREKKKKNMEKQQKGRTDLRIRGCSKDGFDISFIMFNW